MTPTPKRFSRRLENDSYATLAQRPLYSLIFILPALLFFQIGASVYGSRLLAPRDLGKLLGLFGATAPYIPPLFILLVLLIQHAMHRHPWTLKPKVLLGMLGESLVYVVPLYGVSFLSRKLMGTLQSAPAVADPESRLQDFLHAVGAGIYEEFLFRLVLISLVALVFVDLLEQKRKIVLPVAVVVSALLFSLYHHSGEQLMDPASLPWDQVVYRTLAGLWLGVVFAYRGFGIAVGAHALFNVSQVLWRMM